MTHQIEAGMRERIAAFLPSALETALASYQLFSRKETHEENPQKFKAYHDACKVALAHIELLMKLVKLANLPDPKLNDEMKQADLAALIENARKELGEG